MDHKVFHGNLKPSDIAKPIYAKFNRGNYQVQQIGDNENIIVQIATRRDQTSGGRTSIGVSIKQFDDGVMVQIGKQDWISLAASLGSTALRAIRNPFSLLGRIDDLAQDIESFSLRDEIWSLIHQTVRSKGASHELSERLRRYVCDYCNTPNPPGELNCIACGAPLGDIQPETCKNCGFLVLKSESICPNCKNKLG
jgi:hypothetical protein